MSDLSQGRKGNQIPAAIPNESELRRRIGTNAQRLRAAQVMTAEEIADQCQLHPAEYRRLEAGERIDVDLKLLRRLGRALEVDPTELLEQTPRA